MNIIPTNKYVLCEKINEEKEQKNLNGFIYEKENLILYKIIKIDSAIKERTFSEGDIIMTNSIPTKIRYGETRYFLMNINNIASKIS